MSQPLAEYFCSLREQARRFPLLEREGLVRLGMAAVEAECRRRRYGSPRRRHLELADWIEHFMAKQAADRPPSLREVAKRAQVDVRMIWQLEHGDPQVGVDTLKALLILGLGLPANGQAVRRGLALWAAERTDMPQIADDLLNGLSEWRNLARRAPEGFAEFLAEAVPLLAKLDPALREPLAALLRDPKTLAALLPGLAKLGRRPRKRAAGEM